MYPDADEVDDDDEVTEALKRKVPTKKEKREQMLKKEAEERESMAIDLLNRKTKKKYPHILLFFSLSLLLSSLPSLLSFLSLKT